jgi:hypothetical protein
MENNQQDRRLLLRIIGDQQDIDNLIRSLEQIYGVRLYPSIPDPDKTYCMGMYRVYVKVPRKEVG